MKLGNYEIQISVVEVKPTDDGWLQATVGLHAINWSHQTDYILTEIEAGCYSDPAINDDHDSWSVADEGERALIGLIGADSGQMRGLFPETCRNLGIEIANAIIEASNSE